MHPARIVISPGPGHPSSDAGVCAEVLQAFEGVSEIAQETSCGMSVTYDTKLQKIPILGVCMGMQVMYEAYGGTVAFAGEIKHGKSSSITHDGKGVFKGIPSPYKVVRYHSLAGTAATLPSQLEVSAETANGIIQAVRHKQFWVEGVQFHPESILTEHGMKLLQNFCDATSGIRLPVDV
jgi:anthranilate synthase/aminodeoxychorismate synthase-like glutamine amidotransferase